MDGHEHAAAFAAFEAALAVSPSSALTYILGSVIFGWTGQAERAIEWGERGLRLSPFDPWAFAAFHSLTLGHFQRGHYEKAVNAAHKASRPIQPIASRICFWRRRLRSSGDSKKPRPPLRVFLNCSLPSNTGDNSPAWIARPRLPPLSARRSALPGCQNSVAINFA